MQLTISFIWTQTMPDRKVWEIHQSHNKNELQAKPHSIHKRFKQVKNHYSNNLCGSNNYNKT